MFEYDKKQKNIFFFKFLTLLTKNDVKRYDS